MKLSLFDECERDDERLAEPIDDFAFSEPADGCFGAVNIVKEAERDIVEVELRFESARDL